MFVFFGGVRRFPRGLKILRRGRKEGNYPETYFLPVSPTSLCAAGRSNQFHHLRVASLGFPQSGSEANTGDVRVFPAVINLQTEKMRRQQRAGSYRKL